MPAFRHTERRCVAVNARAGGARRGSGKMRAAPTSCHVHRPLSPALACACLALSMTLVGSYVALSRPLVAALPVFLLAWMRFGIGGIATLHWLRRPANEAPLGARTHRLLFFESLLGNFLFSICMLFGVSMTSAVSAGVIMAGIPAVVAVLSWLFLRERVAPRVWAAVACAAAGMTLLATGRHGQATVSGLLGNALVFGAVLCEAAYATIGKRLSGVLGPRRITALVNLWGLALMTPLGLWQARGFDFAAVRAGTWLLLLFYALAASVWSVWLWMTGLRYLPASSAGVFTSMLPVSATAVGVLVLGESFGALQVVAFALALLGVLLATLPVRPAAVR